VTQDETMNVSNKLTFLRIILSFICIGFILSNTLASLICAFIVFVLASVTDFLDGFFARKHNTVSDLGKLIDPIADKILIIGVFLAFLQLRVVNAWMVAVIMLREFIITGMRVYGLTKKVVLEAKGWGKHKTISQFVALIAIFVSLILLKMFPESRVAAFLYYGFVPLFMWYVVAITFFSGVYYFWIHRKLIRTF
jgi:CDP-diacylglycerol--glycerol-3-phosphate 3-phosphatidyltransferase